MSPATKTKSKPKAPRKRRVTGAGPARPMRRPVTKKLKAPDSIDPNASRGQGRGGQRLADAMEAASSLPALLESVTRLRRVISKGPPQAGDLAEAIESDAALTISVLRAANAGGTGSRAASVPDAIEILAVSELDAIAAEHATYEFFRPNPRWQHVPEQFRRHALAVRYAAERIADLGSVAGREELVAGALVHDVGGLVISALYPAYDGLIADPTITPERRVARERRELGIDHALVGGVLLRRWLIPQVIATAVERHHNDSAEGLAAAIRLADMIAHNSHGSAIDPIMLHEMADHCSLSEERLNRVLYEFPYSHVRRQRPTEPCPLSGREIDALRGLADGRVYKEIAEEMGLSASTVRTHLHNVYRKIGAADRAQAVLLARERAWI